jgi:hypothetical protein
MLERPGKSKTLFDQFSRGYVRHWPSIPAGVQEAKLMTAGLLARQLYREGRGAESLQTLAKATRKGQIIGVFGGLRIFGGSHREISDATAEIKKRGGIIVDASTGQRSDIDGIEMLSRALAMLKGEKVLGDRAAEIGSLGGLAAARAARKLRMSEAQARAIWRDKSLTRNEAISRMPGWTLSTAKHHFKASGRKKGPKARKG